MRIRGVMESVTNDDAGAYAVVSINRESRQAASSLYSYPVFIVDEAAAQAATEMAEENADLRSRLAIVENKVARFPANWQEIQTALDLLRASVPDAPMAVNAAYRLVDMIVWVRSGGEYPRRTLDGMTEVLPRYVRKAGERDGVPDLATEDGCGLASDVPMTADAPDCGWMNDREGAHDEGT